MDAEITASLIKNKRTTLERIEKFISTIYFKDTNLYSRLYSERRTIEDICHWEVPGGVGSWEHWNFKDIAQQNFNPVQQGDTFGPSWSTHWFKLKFHVPDKWQGKRIHLRWDSNSEAMVWSKDGIPLQGLSTSKEFQTRTDYCLSKSWEINSNIHTFYIEMSGCRMFGLGINGIQINPPSSSETFLLETAEICIFNSDIHSLITDLEILHDLAKYSPDEQKGYRALYTGNQMVNCIINGDFKKAKNLARNHFSKSSGQLNTTLALIGNCHLDSAWLWPYSETKRKCARSWASTIELFKDYPDMIFAASQAQQFAWMKEYYPSLFHNIKSYVKEGRFVPVGATWIEMDGLIPSGESFIRQFLYGQKFYLEEFGDTCKEFWLPDTFGYSAQIPQICRHFNINRFLTQKLSWSLVNKFPHHTFVWEGIDGSHVLAHFPPADSYELNVKVEEIFRGEKNFSDKGRSNISAFLYGYGDGGGGPTMNMLERANRLKDVDGLPRLKHMTPNEMFSEMEKHERNLCRWTGELFLELHNGTYTSQATTKKLNRLCEFAAKSTEFLVCLAVFKKNFSSEKIQRLKFDCEEAWKKILLNQFHDVLPGSSIGMVYEDSDEAYNKALRSFEGINDVCFDALSSAKKSTKKRLLTLNTLQWPVEEVVLVSGDSDHQSVNSNYVAIKALPLSFAEAIYLSPPAVSLEWNNGDAILENQFLLVHISALGYLKRLIRKGENNRNVFNCSNPKNGCSETTEKFGNLITLYDDVPLYWDAWDVMDYHLETRKILNSIEHAESVTPIRVKKSRACIVILEWELKISDLSSLRQEIKMTSLSKYVSFKNFVNWRESHKLLKVEFDTGFLSREAFYDIQFGYIKRNTHMNTSWDTAKFEVCGHKWAQIGEYDVGLAVLNDSKYGWSAKGGRLSLSLLRSPKAPDENCDMKDHTFSYAAMPHEGSFQASGVQKAAYEFNCPPLIKTVECDDVTLFQLDKAEGIILEAVKMAEDNHQAAVFRFYECYGRNGQMSMTFADWLNVIKAEDCDGMEVPQSEIECNSSSLVLQFSPFQIRTLKVTFHRN